ncbi:MAG: hypothetical protein WBH85_08455 [Thermoanaerobaculia bacterium]
MRIRSCLAVAVIGSLWIPTVTTRGWAADESFHRLQSDRVNGVHRDVPVEMVPFSGGGITVQLTSPTNELEIHEHLVKLRPAADGTHEVVARVRFSGSAKLVAVLTLAGLPGSLEDDIILPEQEKEIVARVELAQSDEGILVTPVENPKEVEIAIQSELAGRIVTMCEGFSLIPGTGLACDGLEEAFSTVRLPIPPPGDTYLIEYKALNTDERRQMDAYLEAFNPAR